MLNENIFEKFQSGASWSSVHVTLLQRITFISPEYPFKNEIYLEFSKSTDLRKAHNSFLRFAYFLRATHNRLKANGSENLFIFGLFFVI